MRFPVCNGQKPMSEETKPTEHAVTSVPLQAAEPQGSCLASIFCWVVILGIVAFLFSNVLYSQLYLPTEPKEISAAELMEVNLTGQVEIGHSKTASTLRTASHGQS